MLEEVVLIHGGSLEDSSLVISLLNAVTIGLEFRSAVALAGTGTFQKLEEEKKRNGAVAAGGAGGSGEIVSGGSAGSGASGSFGVSASGRGPVSGVAGARAPEPGWLLGPRARGGAVAARLVSGLVHRLLIVSRAAACFPYSGGLALRCAFGLLAREHLRLRAARLRPSA
jgi:hypothetical protein